MHRSMPEKSGPKIISAADYRQIYGKEPGPQSSSAAKPQRPSRPPTEEERIEAALSRMGKYFELDPKLIKYYIGQRRLTG